MRVLLVTLHSKFVHASLALPYLAAYCEDLAGCEILIRECTIHEPKEQILAMLLACAPDLVGFSVYIWNRGMTLELADALHEAEPELDIVVGGPEVSFDGPELLACHPGLSAIVRGEGEAPWRELLQRRLEGRDCSGIPRVLWRGVGEGPAAAPLDDLDTIPSPFAAGRADITRGLVYLETSRGCPFGCSFCLSARDRRVRSFSMARIEADLLYLMKRDVPQVKLVDRTFNFDPARARAIFRFILRHNRKSRFHFEIGAALLDGETLDLLRAVPEGMFQFEIGIQSLNAVTLAAIGRPFPDEAFWRRLRCLREETHVVLHLDLIGGLPKENLEQFLSGMERVLEFRPHNLQIEPVKVLPGTPLRAQAASLGMCFDPHPPYTVLRTPECSFADLDRLRQIDRLLDLLYNSGRFGRFLEVLRKECGGYPAALETLRGFWKERELFRLPPKREELFRWLWRFAESRSEMLREALALDLARSGRPREEDLFPEAPTTEERHQAQLRVEEELAGLKGRGVKLQHFVAVFRHLPEFRPRTSLLFLYRVQAGQGLTVSEERLLPPK